MSNVKSFFALLDRYLIEDLEVMVCKVPAGKTGGLGYPAMQAILSGMELLGMVLSGGKWSTNAFNYFWEEHFAKDNPQYDQPGLCEIFRDSIRNGIAHLFLMKFGIRLSKAGKANLTRKEGDLNIDVICFYSDFRKTYIKVKHNLLNAGMNSELLDSFSKGYTKLVEQLAASRCKVDRFMKAIPNIPEAPEGELQGETGSIDSYKPTI